MFENSRKAISSIIDTLKKILDVFSVILFIGFTLFYLYQLYNYSESLSRIIIYGVLLYVHTLSFALSKNKKIDKDASHAEKYVQKQGARVRRNVFKIIKMSVNACAIIWNITDIFRIGVSDFNIMIIVVTALLLFLQIILEIILNIFVTHFDDLRIAIIEDIKSVNTESSFKIKMFAKIMGFTKELDRITDDNYFSEEEKEIAKRLKDKPKK